jgi:hypothetical protein
MTDRNRATTLRLRTPTPPAAPGALAPRSFATLAPRSGGGEVRRPQVQTFVPRRADPTSDAILEELAALGLFEPDAPA